MGTSCWFSQKQQEDKHHASKITFGILRNYEDTNALREELVKDYNNEIFLALLSTNETPVSDSATSNHDKTSNNVYSGELYYNAARIVKCYEESRSSGLKKF